MGAIPTKSGVKRDYYDVLGIGRTAKPEEVKRAFRKLAMEFHPDRVPEERKAEAEERFKEISEAYEVLADEEKRGLYDQYGHAGVDQQVWGGQGFDWSRFTRASDLEDVFGSDIFSELFGGGAFGDLFGGGRRRRRGGRDLRFDLEIDLEDVTRGARKTIEVPRSVSCRTCAGTGAEGGKVVRCDQCSGSGQASRVQQRGNTRFVTIGTCPKCRGRGQWPERPCAVCNGAGVLRERDVLTIDVPSGARDGVRLRVSGKGEAYPGGGPAGDLYVILHLREHPVFRRQDRDLLLDLPINISQAVLGAEVEVPTIDGTARVKIAPGTQTHTFLRLRRKGLPDLDGRGRGDQLVRVVLVIPTNLTADERRFFEGLSQLESAPRRRGLFDRFRG